MMTTQHPETPPKPGAADAARSGTGTGPEPGSENAGTEVPGPSVREAIEEATAEAAEDEHLPPPAGGTANLAAALVTLGLGVLGVVVSVTLGVGTPAEPGTGMWPLALSVALVVLSLAQIVVGRTGGDGEKFTRHSWYPAVGLATLLVMVALLPVIGFEIPSLLLCLVWTKFLGGETWRSAVLTSVVTVGVLYAIFVGAFSTNVPHLF
jgi:hypothetical protein